MVANALCRINVIFWNEQINALDGEISHLLIIIIIMIGNLQSDFRNSKRFTVELKEKHTMRKYTGVQNIKINEHFHTKHGKNTSNI